MAKHHRTLIPFASFDSESGDPHRASSRAFLRRLPRRDHASTLVPGSHAASATSPFVSLPWQRETVAIPVGFHLRSSLVVVEALKLHHLSRWTLCIKISSLITAKDKMDQMWFWSIAVIASDILPLMSFFLRYLRLSCLSLLWRLQFWVSEISEIANPNEAVFHLQFLRWSIEAPPILRWY